MARKAWVTDAQMMKGSDVEQSEIAILLKNGGVEDYLSSNRIQSATVVGPKGFGKTFILKSKRIALEKLGHRCLPSEHVVDRPNFTIPQLDKRSLYLLRSSETWMSIWAMAVSLVSIKSLYQSDDSAGFIKLLKDFDIPEYIISSVKSLHNNNVYGIINHLLSLGVKKLEQLLAKAYLFIEAMTSSVRDAVSIFIDNADEYVDPVLSKNFGDEIREDRYDLWHNAQIGLWKATRLLHGVNPKVRIFSTIRKEAYHYATVNEPQIQNLDAFSVHLSYTNPDLLEIIENNIAVDANVVDKTNKKPMVRFVGEDAERMVSFGTGEVELLASYWVRHCVGRPRDVVAVGAAISNLSPIDRTADRVREMVNITSRQQVEKLFTEAKFHIDGLEPDLLSHAISSNVMSRKEIEEGAEAYSAAVNELRSNNHAKLEGDASHVFCLLYSLGLVGVVKPDTHDLGVYRQEFAKFGEIPLGKNGILPNADEYLIHPGLTDFLISRDATFVEKLDRINIIGDAQLWRSGDDFVYVLTANTSDLLTKSSMDSGEAALFTTWWNKELGKRAKKEAPMYFHNLNGDQLVIADARIEKVIRIAKSVASALKKSKFNLEVGFAGHCGFAKLDAPENGGLSSITKIANRIDRFDTRGNLVVSEQFLKGLAEETILNEGDFNPYIPNSASDLGPDNSVNVSDQIGQEEFVRLWKLAL